MGDQTNVELYVKECHAEQVRQMILDHAEHSDDENIWNDGVCFTFWECNYGDLSFEKDMQQAGIAYDKEWGAGGNYGPGNQYCRFTEDGEIKVFDVADDEIDPPIHKLLELIDDPAALRQYILEYKDETTPLPWNNQETYGKRYLARQLIMPT